MPRQARELTALDVRRLAHPGGGRGNVTVAAGGVAGLLLQLTPGGGRTWLLRALVGGKRREGCPDGGRAMRPSAERRGRRGLGRADLRPVGACS